MGIYKSRIVEIEAHQLTVDDMEQLEKWCNGSIKGTMLPPEERIIEIKTLEGEMEANIGDYIIKGLKGEFYPCKPDIFAMKYDLIGE